jgi:hypothetical protein
MIDFRATQKQSPVVLLLRGDLTVSALEDALAPIEAELRRGSRGLLVDVRRVTNLHGDARERFLRWNKEHRAEISALAIVTESTAWRMVIKGLALMGGQKLRAFDEPIRATVWLSER